jgi:putative ABC transport system permease protein
MLHANDVAATGLIQTGSRARWRLLLAGAPAEVEAFRQQASAQLARGERIENVEEARPEIRTALERAKRVLGLTALLAVALSAVAVALACRRYVNRHRQAVAVMRCLGASQGDMLWLHLSQFFALALLAGLAGCALGWLTQELVLAQLASLLGQSLPPAGWQPWAQGLAVGATLLFGFAVPPLLAWRRPADSCRARRRRPAGRRAARPAWARGAAPAAAARQSQTARRRRSNDFLVG